MSIMELNASMTVRIVSATRISSCQGAETAAVGMAHFSAATTEAPAVVVTATRENSLYRVCTPIKVNNFSSCCTKSHLQAKTRA